jgi:hypothetical protein
VGLRMTGARPIDADSVRDVAPAVVQIRPAGPSPLFSLMPPIKTFNALEIVLNCPCRHQPLPYS